MNDDLLDADWTAHESALLGSAELDVAPEGSTERTLAALGLGVALAASGSALAASSVPAKAAAVNGVAVWLKWAASLLVGAGVVGAVVVALRQSPESSVSAPQPRASAAPVASALAAPPSPISAAEPVLAPPVESREARGERVGSERVSGFRPPPRPPLAKVAIAEELRVIDEARRLLRAGNASGALEKLGSYDVLVGAQGGKLRAEATVVRIEALKASGWRRQASLLCRQFLADYPRSPYAAHVKRLLATVTAVPD
jgi:hypothetical protein